MKFSSKLIIIGGIATAVPALSVLAMLFWKTPGIAADIQVEIDALAKSQLEEQTRSVLQTAQLVDTMLRATTVSYLSTAETILEQAGKVEPSPSENAKWNAINQITKRSNQIELPRLLVGGNWLGQERNFDSTRRVPLIDDVGDRTGITCTLFQRMNEQGDMLRVATNVKTLSGHRAISTYIPNASPVVQTVLKGETFFGRAYVVNQFYITAYKPLHDDNGRVIAILYVGLPEAAATNSIKETLAQRSVGETGHIFILNTTGSNEGKLILSKNRQRDGQRFDSLVEQNGSPSLKAFVERGKSLQADQIEFLSYRETDGGSSSRDMVAAIAYYSPWDWLISTCISQEELNAASKQASESLVAIRNTELYTTVVAIALALGFFYQISRRLARRIKNVADRLEQDGAQTHEAAEDISRAFAELAQGSHQQVARLEETSAAVEQISSMTQKNVEAAQKANSLTSDARSEAESSKVEIGEMVGAMQDMAKSSADISSIISTIDEIAFQTNILALNAAVEAARAGEAGAGFAIVADEVRTLAQRSAEAARDTSAKIEEAIAKSASGSEICSRVANSLSSVAEKIQNIDQLVEEIASSSQDQSIGIKGITSSIVSIDSITQQHASNSHGMTDRTDNLKHQAGSLQEMLGELVEIIEGQGTTNQQAAQPSQQQPKQTLELAQA